MNKITYIKFIVLFFLIHSCETVSDWTDNIVSGDEELESVQNDGELLSDDLGSDPTLEEILAESEDSVEDVVLQDSAQFQESEEKLPPAPTEDYDTTMIEPDTSFDSPLSTQDNLNEDEKLIEDENQAVSQKQSVQALESTFQRSVLDLNDQIQYRVATITFSSGSSNVNIDGLKKIKKIAKIAKERNAKIKIIGHASERTKDMPIAKHKIVNFVISDKRANSVAEVFIKKYKFPSKRLITQGVSDSKPLFKEIMPAGTKANQRTEIFLIY